MKRYELYLTLSIMKMPCQTETETVPLHVVPNLSQQAHYQLEIVFLRSAFLETADQTSKSDYRPIVIGSRSIGAPLEMYYLINYLQSTYYSDHILDPLILPYT